MIRVIIPLLANPGKLIQILFLTVFRVVNQSLIITPISGKLIHKREFRRRIFGKLIQAIHQIWMAFSRNQSRPENWILEKISSFFQKSVRVSGKLKFRKNIEFSKLDEFPKIGWVSQNWMGFPEIGWFAIRNTEILEKYLDEFSRICQ